MFWLFHVLTNYNIGQIFCISSLGHRNARINSWPRMTTPCQGELHTSMKSSKQILNSWREKKKITINLSNYFYTILQCRHLAIIDHSIRRLNRIFHIPTLSVPLVFLSTPPWHLQFSSACLHTPMLKLEPENPLHLVVVLFEDK